jgi:hypothetical protein
MIEAGRKRYLMAVIARKIDDDEVRILKRERHHYLPGVVARAVIDEDDFVIFAEASVGDRNYAPEELGKTGLLVKTGRHHRQAWSWPNLHWCIGQCTDFYWAGRPGLLRTVEFFKECYTKKGYKFTLEHQRSEVIKL